MYYVIGVCKGTRPEDLQRWSDIILGCSHQLHKILCWILVLKNALERLGCWFSLILIPMLGLRGMSCDCGMTRRGSSSSQNVVARFTPSWGFLLSWANCDQKTSITAHWASLKSTVDFNERYVFLWVFGQQRESLLPTIADSLLTLADPYIMFMRAGTQNVLPFKC